MRPFENCSNSANGSRARFEMAAPRLPYPRSTLVLIGHGSTLENGSAASTYQHAAAIRKLGLFDEVIEAFWKIEPNIANIASAARSTQVFYVPIFIAEGYFTHEVLPRALGFATPDGFTRTRKLGSQTFHYCEPAGTHPAITEVVQARAREVLREYPFPRAPKESDCALILVGHGTPRNENSRRAVEEQVIRLRSLNRFGEVHGTYLEEQPQVRQCYALTKLKNLIVVPFFMSEGLHSHQQIPVLLGESEAVVQKRLQQRQPTWRNPTEKQGKRVWYSQCVGTDPRVVELILDRVDERTRN